MQEERSEVMEEGIQVRLKGKKGKKSVGGVWMEGKIEAQETRYTGEREGERNGTSDDRTCKEKWLTLSGV